MTKVKICGISKAEDALIAARAGADFIGFVFAPSPRRVTPEQAKHIIEGVLMNQPHPLTVGVFVNDDIDYVNRTAKEIGLDYVQLSGEETLTCCREISKPVIKVCHISAGKTAAQVIKEISDGLDLIPGGKLIYLLDTSGKGGGGTGQSFDWAIAREVAARFPVIIAGGLNPDNVARLVREVNPWGIDVSSGVETGGQKDPDKIRAFIRTVKAR